MVPHLIVGQDKRLIGLVPLGKFGFRYNRILHVCTRNPGKEKASEIQGQGRSQGIKAYGSPVIIPVIEIPFPVDKPGSCFIGRIQT